MKPSQEKLHNAVTAKLTAEGLTIESDWNVIEACLSEVVAPSVCIAAAAKMRKVYIFSSGSQFADWEASNCERCTKYVKDGYPDCEIAQELLQAYIDDGKLTPEIAARAGVTPDNEMSYVWPCAEVVWTEEWKAELTAKREDVTV